MIGNAIIPIPMKPGSPNKEHYEYIRNGTRCIFMAFEPRAGKRMTCVKEHRAKVDYADFMRMLAQHYPDAESIMFVQDNLDNHTSVSSYEVLPPDEASRLAKRFEYHCTPKKESCLNIAEIELSAHSRQCLDRRNANMANVADEVSAWERERNAIRATVRRRFNKDNARAKL